MDAIELMVNEHNNIIRLLKVSRVFCIKLMDNKDVDYDVFYSIMDFVRNYADKHHHNKEESILFKSMGEHLGETVSKGPIAGMLIEHDLGRLYMSNLEQALERVKNGDKDSRVDIIANVISYADLLSRHIDKENKVIYTFARRALTKEAMEDIEDKCNKVERDAEKNNTQSKYLEMIHTLEKKAGI